MSTPILNTEGLRDGNFGMSAHTCPDVQENVEDEAGKDPTSEGEVHLFHNCLVPAAMYAVSFRMLQMKQFYHVGYSSHGLRHPSSFSFWSILYWEGG